MGNNIGKNIKLLDYAKQSSTNAIKTTSKWAIQKTADATGIAKKITKNSAQNNSETDSETVGKSKTKCVSREKTSTDHIRLLTL